MRALPAPDYLDLALPEGCSCLLSGDATPLAAALTEALNARGWPVVRWEPVSDEAQMQQQLANLRVTCGPVAVFIGLASPGVNDYFPARDEAWLKNTFLMAKHLKASLAEAAQRGFAAFMTVTRLDGALGLVGGGSPLAGGVAGLVKTLALEWPDVHCRALDLNPDLIAQRAAGLVLAELHDPNRRLVEVGWGAEGRVTVVAEGAGL